MTFPLRPRVAVFGAGGHAAVVLDVLSIDSSIEVMGVVCPDVDVHHPIGCPVLGTDDDLRGLAGSVVTHFIVAVGSVGDSSLRRGLFEYGQSLGLIAVNAIHPSSVISSSVTLGRGVAIMAGSIVNARARIGDNCIVNTGAIVEHDCEIGAHAHIASGAVLGGHVAVGVGVHVGAGATVKHGLRVAERAVIGIGAAVVKDVDEGQVVVGVPARPLRRGRNQ